MTPLDILFERGVGPLGFQVEWVEGQPIVKKVRPQGPADGRGTLIVRCTGESAAGADASSSKVTLLADDGMWIDGLQVPAFTTFTSASTSATCFLRSCTSARCASTCDGSEQQQPIVGSAERAWTGTRLRNCPLRQFR